MTKRSPPPAPPRSGRERGKASRRKERPRRQTESDLDLLGALILAPAWLAERVYSWIKRKVRP